MKYLSISLHLLQFLSKMSYSTGQCGSRVLLLWGPQAKGQTLAALHMSAYNPRLRKVFCEDTCSSFLLEINPTLFLLVSTIIIIIIFQKFPRIWYILAGGEWRDMLNAVDSNTQYLIDIQYFTQYLIGIHYAPTTGLEQSGHWRKSKKTLLLPHVSCSEN